MERVRLRREGLTQSVLLRGITRLRCIDDGRGHITVSDVTCHLLHVCVRLSLFHWFKGSLSSPSNTRTSLVRVLVSVQVLEEIHVEKRKTVVVMKREMMRVAMGAAIVIMRWAECGVGDDRLQASSWQQWISRSEYELISSMQTSEQVLTSRPALTYFMQNF